MRIKQSLIILFVFCIKSSLIYCQDEMETAKPDTVCISCDTTINLKLVLNQPKSIIKHLDGDFKKKMQAKTSQKKIFPSLFYKNNNASQYLKIVNFAGGNESTCSYFEVGYVHNKLKENYNGKSSNLIFATESGIKLGMSYFDFLMIKGEKYRLFSLEGGVNTYFYHYGHAIFQTRVTADDPIYIAVYKFKQNKLISFGFGYLPVIPD